MLYPLKLHRHSMQMTVLSDSNLDLTCIKEWSSSFAFKRFGLICHVGRGGAKSKTEAMYFPPPQQLYQDANTLPLEIDGGCVTFTQSLVKIIVSPGSY